MVQVPTLQSVLQSRPSPKTNFYLRQRAYSIKLLFSVYKRGSVVGWVWKLQLEVGLFLLIFGFLFIDVSDLVMN
jgi:hypothetical protein